MQAVAGIKVSSNNTIVICNKSSLHLKQPGAISPDAGR